MRSWRQSLIGFILATLAALPAGPGATQPFPSKPIRLILPTAAGSVPDVAVRLLAQELSDRWGQPLLVINRAGANGVLSTDVCAKAEPDGTTLCVVSQDSMSYNVFTMP